MRSQVSLLKLCVAEVLQSHDGESRRHITWGGMKIRPNAIREAI